MPGFFSNPAFFYPPQIYKFTFYVINSQFCKIYSIIFNVIKPKHTLFNIITLNVILSYG
jgi:hypothetical protein